MTDSYKLIDTTLREGEQTPGLNFSLEQKKSIVDHLAQVGVAEVELGIASPLSHQLAELLAYCAGHHPGLRTSLWARCLDADIRHAAELGGRVVSLSIPVSDIHLRHKLERDRAWACRTLAESIGLAIGLGLEVAVGFEDATRAEAGFVREMARLAEEAGAVRIRLADTVGVASPGSLSRLVEQVGEVTIRAELGVHTHNDFGLACGNAVAALEAGANWADGALLGLGERAGCAPLEQLVAYLVILRGEGGMQLKPLKSLALYLAAEAGVVIGSREPLLGEAIFSCESGLHLDGLFKEPRTYEPYPPERIGSKRRLLIGAKSGKAALGHQLERLGLLEGPASEARLDGLVEKVRRAGRDKGRGLTLQELKSLWQLS
ncbi:LeuA family protein [Desulfogranum mediterraneum]|uniref:LeuA family protein n=1 Tax=Desulfogranum mediterraneum TaxID=160661 RepID=UPI0004228591|nr:hypothetical protein [Desulfogranum mediterraneum]